VTLEQQRLEKRNRVEIRGAGGVQQGQVHGEGVGAQLGAIAEDDFAKDHGMAQASFGRVIKIYLYCMRLIYQSLELYLYCIR